MGVGFEKCGNSLQKALGVLFLDTNGCVLDLRYLRDFLPHTVYELNPQPPSSLVDLLN